MAQMSQNRDPMSLQGLAPGYNPQTTSPGQQTQPSGRGGGWAFKNGRWMSADELQAQMDAQNAQDPQKDPMSQFRQSLQGLTAPSGQRGMAPTIGSY